MPAAMGSTPTSLGPMAFSACWHRHYTPPLRPVMWTKCPPQTIFPVQNLSKTFWVHLLNSPLAKEHFNFKYPMTLITHIAWQVTVRHLCWKKCASGDEGPSRGWCMVQPVGEDPHQGLRNFIVQNCCLIKSCPFNSSHSVNESNHY